MISGEGLSQVTGFFVATARVLRFSSPGKEGNVPLLLVNQFDSVSAEGLYKQVSNTPNPSLNYSFLPFPLHKAAQGLIIVSQGQGVPGLPY